MWLGAIDSQLLLDACDGDRMADETLFTLRVRGYLPTASTTTVHELMDMALEDKNQLAMDGLSMLSRQPHHAKIYAPEIDRVDYGYACSAADLLLDKSLVPDMNLGLIIAEAASLQAKVILLDDEILHPLDQKAINSVLSDRQLATLIFQSQGQFLED